MARQQSNRNKPEKSKIRPDTPSTKCLIAGKLDENDWIDILDDAEAEEIASEYVSDLMDHVMDEAYKHYLKRQLIPFTVHQTAEALLQMVKLEFLKNDPGDCIMHADWLKDSVPMPCKIDSWAQGAISKRCTKLIPQSPQQRKPRSNLLDADVSTTTKSVTMHGTAESTESKPNSDNPDTVVDQDSIKSTAPLFNQNKSNKTEVKDCKVKKPKSSMKQEYPIKNSLALNDKPLDSSTYQTYRGKLGAAPVSRMQEPLDAGGRKNQELRRKPEPAVTKPMASQLRFPGSQKFAFDDEGNLVAVPRLVSTPTQVNRANKQTVLLEQPTDRLGSLTNTVNLKWRVIPSPGDEQIQATLEGPEHRMTPDPQKKRSLPNGPQDFQMLRRKLQVKAMASGLFSVVDSMDPMPGVTVSDGERRRVGMNANQEQIDQLLNCRWDKLQQVQPISEATMTNPRLPPESLVKLDDIQVCRMCETDMDLS